MIVEQSKQIIAEIEKAFIGKREIVEKVLMTIYAGGHVLLEDCPGVGKTTLALAFSRVLGLDHKRIQFTTDTLPSDITGFSVWNRETRRFDYRDGAANCQLLLADEINRTSPKTQSALLEVMEEHTITVDGVTRPLPTPFVCIAAQNPPGLLRDPAPAGIPAGPLHGPADHRLPHPGKSAEDPQRPALSQPPEGSPGRHRRGNILEVQEYLSSIRAADPVLAYAIRLCKATRSHPPGGTGHLSPGHLRAGEDGPGLRRPPRAELCRPGGCAGGLCRRVRHRLVLRPQARVDGVSTREPLTGILAEVRPETGAER